MAKLTEPPFPPGSYPVMVVGSGPGGLQTSYSLKRLGIAHAVISRDEGPGGMFRQYPIFDRLISWTKPNAPTPKGSREGEWYDWNSLLVDDPQDHISIVDFMNGASEFPTRAEMEQSLAAFTNAHVPVRYGCSWQKTRRADDGTFVLETSDGEYRCKAVVFAVGVTEPWKPPTIPGIEEVVHSMELKAPQEYAGKSIYIIGKGTAAFEIADGLLPWASQIVLSSPGEAPPSVVTHSLAGIRARYMQPLEDHAISGRTVTVLDAATERIERVGSRLLVCLKGTRKPWDMQVEFDEVVAATGVATPMLDLPDLGVETISRGGKLPVQNPFWACPAVPGIYFSGSITQGARGIRGYGPGAVHGFRYSSRLVAQQIAKIHFGYTPQRPSLKPGDVTPYLLEEASHAPELWHQRALLARSVTIDKELGIFDEGIVPLAHFVDEAAPDGVAVTVFNDEEGDLHPVVYVRADGKVDEHILESNIMLDFATPSHHAELDSLLKGMLG
ncbi:MAG: NAD(P)-binding domain-containing protein [Actinomycetota bacterium]